MIQMLFSLRFQAQLRRTRPELCKYIENAVVETIKASGGMVGFERRHISASFDEAAIGFWIDVLTVVETIVRIMEEADSELYGHLGILGRDLGEEGPLLFQTLPSGGTGIWCDPFVQKALAPYGVFENNPLNGRKGSPGAAFARLKDIRAPQEEDAAKFFPYRDKIRRILSQGNPRNAVLTGPGFIGKRDGVRRFCAALLGEIPPLIFTFGAGGTGLSCFSDALNPAIRSLIAPAVDGEVMEELEGLGAAIFRERFRDHYSGFLVQKAGRFLRLLLETYGAALKQRNLQPLLILENIHEAAPGAIQIFAEQYQPKPVRDRFLAFGTCSDGIAVKPGIWGGIFSRIIQFSREDFNTPPLPELPKDLWEIAYAFGLFRRHFPPGGIHSLFEEAGRNPRMVSRALDFFSQLGIIDFKEDPQPRMGDFIAWAEEALGDRKKNIRLMVRERILAWVQAGKIKPCFNLLRAIAELEGESSDALVLDSLTGDIINGTYQGIDEAMDAGQFEAVTGERRYAHLRYIVVTGKALIHGGEGDIREAFLEGVPEADSFPIHKARILANLAAYHFSVQDIPAALEAVKESMIISQNQKEGKGLAMAYRLFSLVNLSKQRLEDAIEYFSFAIENAEGFGNTDELAVAAYYAAGTHFLYGNLSKAIRFAQQAETAAALSGRIDWAGRARFLQGRLLFETGYYQEAQTTFESLETRNGSVSNRDLTLAAWIFRTDVLLRASKPRKPKTLNDDARLFEIEAAYLTGDYEHAVKLADAFSTELPEDTFLFIEQPDWRSGFSQCELLLFSRRNFFTRLLSTYRALALSHLGRPRENARSEAKSEAQDSMRRIIREEGRPQTDPSDAFYFYSYYCVLQESGAVEVDMNTAVSMAFKRLQSRASRIDDPETKRAFLSLNHWNKALGQAAKRHKLI